MTVCCMIGLDDTPGDHSPLRPRSCAYPFDEDTTSLEKPANNAMCKEIFT